MVDGSRSRGRTEAWRPWSAAGRRPALIWPENLADLTRGLAERVRRWALADVGPGRLVPWLAVAFGFGIVLYFTAEQEPAVWAALVLAIMACTGAVLARHRPVAFPLALALAAAAAGFATATVKRAIIAHPVLQAAAWNVEIAGFVEVREERERSDRITVRVHRLEGAPHHRKARTGADLGAPRHGAAGRRLHRAQGAIVAAARHRCVRVVTTSRAIPTSSGSAPRVSCSAASASSSRRRRPAFGCATPRRSTLCAKPSTSASARSCPATRARSRRR